MRLLTHNMLQCHAVGCTTNNFPLIFQDIILGAEQEAEYNAEFIKSFITRIDWHAFYTASRQLGFDQLPEEFPEHLLSSVEEDPLFRIIHHLLMEIQIKDGKMTCNNCGHSYEILNGIPNMLLLNDK